MKSQELAEKLGISVGYLSQLEHGRQTNPSPELLDNLASVLHLSKQETETLYDLYAKANGTLSPDAAAYAASRPIVVQALRSAQDAYATGIILNAPATYQAVDRNQKQCVTFGCKCKLCDENRILHWYYNMLHMLELELQLCWKSTFHKYKFKNINF